MYDKKAELELSLVAKLVIAVTVLVVVLLLYFMFGNKSSELFLRIKDMLRFG